MAELIPVIDVIVPAAPVVDVTAIGVQGPPGASGPAGPPGPQGPAGTAGLHAATHAVGGADALAGSLAATDVRVGANPAQTGAIRLANNQPIMARNAANSADVEVAAVGTDGHVRLGHPGQVTWLQSSATIGQGEIISWGALRTGSVLGFTEIAAPAAPAANEAIVFVQDNGAGKTRLMVQFATGAAIQLAIQP
jgi:hypothetical protein